MAATTMLNFGYLAFFDKNVCMYSVSTSQYPYQIYHLISQIVKKWQTFSEIEDSGGRHLELWLRRFFDVTDVI